MAGRAAPPTEMARMHASASVTAHATRTQQVDEDQEASRLMQEEMQFLLGEVRAWAPPHP